MSDASLRCFSFFAKLLHRDLAYLYCAYHSEILYRRRRRKLGRAPAKVAAIAPRSKHASSLAETCADTLRYRRSCGTYRRRRRRRRRCRMNPQLKEKLRKLQLAFCLRSCSTFLPVFIRCSPPIGHHVLLGVCVTAGGGGGWL